MSRLEVRMLGPLEARFDGLSLDLGTRKQRALFALLITDRRRPVSVDRIISALWGSTATEKRRGDVWVYASRLRKGLLPAGELLSRNGDGYVLEVADDAVDVFRFESLVAAGRRQVDSDPPAASELFGEALEVWSGEAFGEFADEEFVAAEAVRLEEARLAVREMKLDADLAWAEPSVLISEAEGLVAAHPLRSRLTAALMIALYRHDRQADALLAYRAFAERMEEMGLQPPAHLSRLEGQILVEDAVLRKVRRFSPTRNGEIGFPCRARS